MKGGVVNRKALDRVIKGWESENVREIAIRRHLSCYVSDTKSHIFCRVSVLSLNPQITQFRVHTATYSNNLWERHKTLQRKTITKKYRKRKWYGLISTCMLINTNWVSLSKDFCEGNFLLKTMWMEMGEKESLSEIKCS